MCFPIAFPFFLFTISHVDKSKTVKIIITNKDQLAENNLRLRKRKGLLILVPVAFIVGITSGGCSNGKAQLMCGSLQQLMNLF